MVWTELQPELVGVRLVSLTTRLHVSWYLGSVTPPVVGNRLSESSSTCSSPQVWAASWWITVAWTLALALTRNEKLVMLGLLLPQSMPGATPPTPGGAPPAGVPTTTIA